ncbi:hypothetical protein [Methylobacterium sp. D54C]
MTNVIRFQPRPKRTAVPDTRVRIEGALALALDAVDHLVAALDDMDGNAMPSSGAAGGDIAQVVWLRGNDHDLERS